MKLIIYHHFTVISVKEISKQILITNYSSAETIKNYLDLQLESAFYDFQFNLDNRNSFLIFKYKQIEILF